MLSDTLKMNVFLLLFLQAIVYVQSASIVKSEFELSIIHFNDFHARFQPINQYAGTCSKKEENCIGGFARLYAAIMKLKKETPDSILLNAGDNFQGSLWYNFYKWKAVVHFLNKLPFDAHTIGNHEFDDEVETAVSLIRNLDAPVVISNIDDTNEPHFQNTYKKSIIIERMGRRIGVIGAVVTSTAETSRPGKLKFLNELESINKEAKRLVDEDKVDTIIVLSHCGYATELDIAKNAADKISIIVGGHSHSLLYNGKPPNNLTVHGPYPTVVQNIDGRNVLVVQASSFTRFLAEIRLRFDKDGNLISWTGEPTFLNQNVPVDPEIFNEIMEWQKAVDAYGNRYLGVNLVTLESSICYNFECNMGDFVTDAMVDAYTNATEVPYATIAFVNTGSLRNPINVGNVTVGNLLEAMPYDNTVDKGELKGKYIKEALEHAALITTGSRHLLQLSGIRVVYNMTKPEGSRVQQVKVLCRICKTPSYIPLEMEKVYRIILNTYLVKGGDGFTSISNNLRNHEVGKEDREIVQDYIIRKSPINQVVDGRITFVE